MEPERKGEQVVDAEATILGSKTNQPESTANKSGYDQREASTERDLPAEGPQIIVANQHSFQEQRSAVMACTLPAHETFEHSIECPSFYQWTGASQPTAPVVHQSSNQLSSWVVPMDCSQVSGLTNQWQGYQTPVLLELQPTNIQVSSSVQPDGQSSAVYAQPARQGAPEITTHIEPPSPSQPCGVLAQTCNTACTSEARRIATDRWVGQQAASLQVRPRNQARRSLSNLRSWARTTNKRRPQGVMSRMDRQRAMAKRHATDSLRVARNLLRRQQDRRQARSKSTCQRSPNPVVSASSISRAPLAGVVKLKQQQPKAQIGAGTLNDPIVLDDTSLTSPETDVFTVEDIRDSRWNSVNSVTEWFVKWKNFPEEDNTWEPTSNLRCPDLIAKFEARKRETKTKTERKGSSRVPTKSPRTVRMSTGARNASSTSGIVPSGRDSLTRQRELREALKKARETLITANMVLDRALNTLDDLCHDR